MPESENEMRTFECGRGHVVRSTDDLTLAQCPHCGAARPLHEPGCEVEVEKRVRAGAAGGEER